MSHRFATLRMAATFAFMLGGLWPTAVLAAPEPAAPDNRFYIREYRVQGVKHLQSAEVEDTVYPFMGPERTADDVEQARAALEKLYRAKGYQAASVVIPAQQVKGGIIFLQVAEGTVGKLRVRDSRYFSPNEIKKNAPSLAEGGVLNFNGINRDVVALNQLPDRRVTPSLKAGAEPGVFDVDLTVKDTPPLHGSLELNNRYSPNTTPLRVNGSVSYANLWQLGHTLGFSFQVAPERLDDAKIFSAYYLVHLTETPWLSLLVQATKQDSNISTLGGSAVAGRGETFGIRAIMTLPPSEEFYHSLTLGLDSKHYGQNLTTAGVTTATPITYYPLSAVYSGSWTGKGSATDFNAGPTLGLRGAGSDDTAFNARRNGASGSFISFRADVSRTQDLPAGFQLFGKLQGQIADQPLVDTEEFSGGGLATVRGYLEGEVAGDDALFGSVELRSPSVLGWLGEKSGEWRFYGFADGGMLQVQHPLPAQTADFTLASVGVGSRLRFRDYLSGSIDAGLPLKSQTTTHQGDLRLTFSIRADY